MTDQIIPERGVPVFAAVDMETTGLSAVFDVPLEISCKLVDAYGDPIGDGVTFLICEDNELYNSALARARMNEYVDEMHRKSGLWDDLVIKTKSYRQTVDSALVAYLSMHGVVQGQVPMLGNSIGSLDRPFAINHFPRFHEFLSYRNVDISSIKEIVRVRYPSLYDDLRPVIGTKADATHRSMDDIDACLREYKAYLDYVFTVGE